MAIEPESPVISEIWHAPLVPVALFLSAGIVLDRYARVPLGFSLIVAIVSLAAWAAVRSGGSRGLPLVYLAGAVAALGAGYHHWHREIYPLDDIGNIAAGEPRLVRLRGEIAEAPTLLRHPASDLESFGHPDATVGVLRVTQLLRDEQWQPVSGRARMVLSGDVTDLHVGDEVEAVGRLTAPHGPYNPGEFDYATYLQDQRIRAQFLVRNTADGILRREARWPISPTRWLAAVRAWGRQSLEQALPPERSGVAAALLLGDDTAMTPEDWDRYIRTGVVSVLVISGQHLVVLAAFAWGVLRIMGVRQRRGAWLVALFLFAYTLLAGGRPPVLRSAIVVCVYCGGIALLRTASPANGLALAWIVVAALNPADIFNTGCQLSFLTVAFLYWGTRRWFGTHEGRHFGAVPDGTLPDPVKKLIEENRPAWEQLLRRLARVVVAIYVVNAAVWLAVAPLVASRYHLISPVALLIGPPVVVLTSIALLAGFLLLLTSLVYWPLAAPFAWVTNVSLACCEWLVRTADRAAAVRYVGDVPEWWLWAFYVGLLMVLVTERLRRRWDAAALAGLGWLCVGLLAAAYHPSRAEMRCTFLAVGHGGCTVIETPEGRTLLYDAGALGGPEVTRRQIAPFLWRRGIRRIDEVFLSHADLDHFNGIPALLERFTVGQITTTPTFADRSTRSVNATLEAIERFGIPMRVVRSGDRLTSGTITMEVLHPPASGPEGKENVRSLVLLIRHAEHSILLTGDLEEAGLAQVLSLPAVPVDVLMAPHHGSQAANTPGLANWATPRVVVSCERRPRGPVRPAEPYSASGAIFLGTWPHGAVTVRSSRSGLSVETFRSGMRVDVR